MSLEFEFEEQIFHLGAGDSLIFDHHLPDRWRDAEEFLSRSLFIHYPAGGRDYPKEKYHNSA